MKKLAACSISIVTFGLVALSGCAMEQPEAAAASEDALSEGECKPIAERAVKAFIRDCDGNRQAAVTAEGNASRAFNGVPAALQALNATLAKEGGTLGGLVSRCQQAKPACDTSAFRDAARQAGPEAKDYDVKPTSCYVADAVNSAMCLVDAVPGVIARASNPTVQTEIQTELAALKSSLKFGEYTSNIVKSLYRNGLYALCNNNAAQQAEYTRAFQICRTDCGSDGKTFMGGKGEGGECAPPGLPANVTCGVMKRGTVNKFSCECREGGVAGFFNKCQDYRLAQNRIGELCPTDATKKVSSIGWDNATDKVIINCK